MAASYNFHWENTNHSPAKITPVLRAYYNQWLTKRKAYVIHFKEIFLKIKFNALLFLVVENPQVSSL